MLPLLSLIVYRNAHRPCYVSKATKNSSEAFHYVKATFECISAITKWGVY